MVENRLEECIGLISPTDARFRSKAVSSVIYFQQITAWLEWLRKYGTMR
jgi:hypothetical protein